MMLLAFVIYSASAVLFAVRFWLRSDRWVAAGVTAAGMAFAVHTAVLANRIWISGRLPFSNLYEFTLALAWAILLVFFVWAVRFRLFAAAPVVLALTAGLVGAATMMPHAVRPLMPALRSVWLQIHVATGILAYGALAVSAVLSVFVLAGEEPAARPAEAEGKPPRFWRLPAARELERHIHGLIVFGFVFLSLLIVTGAIWAEETWGRWWGWDPKESWALVTWLIYLVYLHGRTRFGWTGKPVAWFSAVGFLAVLFTLFGVTYLLPGLHSYR